MVLITFKWLRSVILLVTMPGLIKSQSNDTKLSTWYKKIKDPAFECPPLASTRVAEGPEVFTVVDCDAPGARYDYNYKTDSKAKGSKASRVFNGLSTLTFARGAENGNFKYGFKYGKCLSVLSDNIRQIKGKYVDDKLEGPVTIEFTDETFLVGFAKKNRLAGIKRFFDAKSELANVTDAVTGRVYWVRDKYGYFRIQAFEDSNRVLFTENFDIVHNCEQLDSTHLIDCSVVQTHDQEDLTTEGCIAVLSSGGLEMPKKLSDESFKFNARLHQRHNKKDELYPECPYQTEWNSKGVRESVEAWKKSLETQDDLHWYHDADPEPLDLKNPKLKITFDHLAGRELFQKQKVAIMTSEKTLFVGEMFNGTLEADVPSDVANLPDWKAPIFIGVVAGKHAHGIELKSDESPFDRYLVVASGRLRKGRLHGFVVINGVVSNDPKSSCQNLISKGLGFVGHYKDGIPNGVCWKGLIGGAWIYGEVNEEGHFTGDNIAYIYTDMKTALVGKFEKGLMVEGREAEVIGERCNEAGIRLLQLTEPSGPAYHYDPPNSQSFGDQPLLGDPLDNRYMLLKTSDRYPAAGEGAFAKEDIPAFTVFSLYGGRILNKEEMDNLKAEEVKIIKANQWTATHPQAIDFWKYRHTIQICNLVIDIPPEFEPVTKFRGTLGHKVNHSFKPTTAYMNIDSARFGIINALMSLQEISKGEEFFASYGYSFEVGAPWYKELFLEFMTENPNDPKVQQYAGNRSKEELLKIYNNYMNAKPGDKILDVSMVGNEPSTAEIVSETAKE